MESPLGDKQPVEASGWPEDPPWPSGPHSSMQIHDFAQLSENTYHVYHNVEDLRGEPHAVAIRGEDDVHVTEGVYKRPLFLQPTYRYRGPALQGPGVLGMRTWGCPPAGPQPHPLQVGLNGKQGGRCPGRVACLTDGPLPPPLAGTTACPCQSKGLPWKPSLMPLSVSSG